VFFDQIEVYQLEKWGSWLYLYTMLDVPYAPNNFSVSNGSNSASSIGGGYNTVIYRIRPDGTGFEQFAK